MASEPDDYISVRREYVHARAKLSALEKTKMLGLWSGFEEHSELQKKHAAKLAALTAGRRAWEEARAAQGEEDPYVKALAKELTWLDSEFEASRILMNETEERHRALIEEHRELKERVNHLEVTLKKLEAPMIAFMDTQYPMANSYYTAASHTNPDSAVDAERTVSDDGAAATGGGNAAAAGGHENPSSPAPASLGDATVAISRADIIGSPSPQGGSSAGPASDQAVVGSSRSSATSGAAGAGAGATQASSATLATHTLTAATVGETAAKALAGVDIEERLFQKFEQVLIPWEDVELGSEVGTGAFGMVIKADHFGSPVAVKILKPIGGAGAGAEISKFVEEASVLQKVNHLHIVRLMGVCIGEHRYGIVMEFAVGGDLGTFLQARVNDTGDRPLRLQILDDVCKGLNYLHKKGIVHRDIKPANILLDRAISPAKLADFGISGFSATHRGGGTPRYMAPEVIMGDGCTEPSDIFSFGVVIWEVISRQTPYPHAKVNADRTVDRGNLASPPGPSTGDAAIDAIVQATCQLDAASRPSAAALVQSLHAAQAASS